MTVCKPKSGGRETEVKISGHMNLSEVIVPLLGIWCENLHFEPRLQTFRMKSRQIFDFFTESIGEGLPPGWVVADDGIVLFAIVFGPRWVGCTSLALESICLKGPV